MEIVLGENEVDECIEKLKSFYGPGGTLTLSDDLKSYRLELDEQREEIDFEMLKKFLPAANYGAICKMGAASFTKECKLEEQLLRESFHNGGDIPDACKSKLFSLQAYNTDEEVEEGSDSKRKKRVAPSRNE